MALRLSTGLRNFMLQHGSLSDALAGGKLQIYNGSQPSAANTAPSGSILATITDASGLHTEEVLSQGTVTLTGSSGTIDTLTVDNVAIISNVVTFTTDLSTTATLLAAEINSTSSSPDYTASAASGVVTITALPGTGTSPNGFVVASGTTTLTGTDVDMGTTTAGVAAANGLVFGSSAAGVLSKLSTQTWSGAAGATGTAGWFRFVGAQNDAGGTDTTESVIRLDGSIATSGGELNMSSTSITDGATQTVSSFAITLPTS